MSSSALGYNALDSQAAAAQAYLTYLAIQRVAHRPLIHPKRRVLQCLILPSQSTPTTATETKFRWLLGGGSIPAAVLLRMPGSKTCLCHPAAQRGFTERRKPKGNAPPVPSRHDGPKLTSHPVLMLVVCPSSIETGTDPRCDKNVMVRSDPSAIPSRWLFPIQGCQSPP
jgi:hypothetical protein